jgi:hypothetical protein
MKPCVERLALVTVAATIALAYLLVHSSDRNENGPPKGRAVSGYI